MVKKYISILLLFITLCLSSCSVENIQVEEQGRISNFNMNKQWAEIAWKDYKYPTANKFPE